MHSEVMIPPGFVLPAPTMDLVLQMHWIEVACLESKAMKIYEDPTRAVTAS